MITKKCSLKCSQKQKYTIIFKELKFYFFLGGGGGKTHLNKKNVPNFQVHGLELLLLSVWTNLVELF